MFRHGVGQLINRNQVIPTQLRRVWDRPFSIHGGHERRVGRVFTDRFSRRGFEGTVNPVRLAVIVNVLPPSTAMAESRRLTPGPNPARAFSGNKITLCSL